MPNIKFIDTHVHGFPDKLFDAIWSYFDKNYWKIYKRYYSTEIIDFLEKEGAIAYNILNYAHKSNISKGLNDWSYYFGKSSDKIISIGTIHPEDSYIVDEIERVLSPNELDLKGIKLQLMVTDFDPDDSRLDVMYETLIKYKKILILHVGTGPLPDHIINTKLKLSPHVGYKKLIPVLERYPQLKLQVPHLGSMECNSFFDLVAEYPQIHFDTAMSLEFILKKDNTLMDFDFNIDKMLEIQDNIMFGSDFPNIPYEYSVSLNGVLELPVDIGIKKKILYENALKFYNL